jgi:hypothetical protein
MRRGSFQALAPLFALAPRPAKELTESFSALVHLRPYLADGGPHRVVHVGDGAHARTGAMFALKTRAENVSVDPETNVRLLEGWRDQYGIRRFEFRKARILDAIDELNALPPMPTLVTFVHAHVSVDHVLALLRWNVAYTLACCVPGKQLSKRYPVRQNGSDEHVLSCERRFQVLVNEAAEPAQNSRQSCGTSSDPKV